MQPATAPRDTMQPALVIPAELRILLVDDSLPLQIRLKELLTESGIMRVTATAESEQDANRLIDSETFDVMVIDVELRPGSGINVVRHARADQVRGPRPLIIVLTNYALDIVRSRSITAGADYFLDKMREFDRLYPLILDYKRAN